MKVMLKRLKIRALTDGQIETFRAESQGKSESQRKCLVIGYCAVTWEGRRWFVRIGNRGEDEGIDLNSFEGMPPVWIEEAYQTCLRVNPKLAKKGEQPGETETGALATASVGAGITAGPSMTTDSPLTAEDEPLSPEKRAKMWATLQPCERQAYLSFEHAQTKHERQLEDKEAYDFLKENGIERNAGDLENLKDYEPPTFDTWSRQLRKARQQLRENKYRRRGAPRTTRSIVKGDEIENQKGDEE